MQDDGEASNTRMKLVDILIVRLEHTEGTEDMDRPGRTMISMVGSNVERSKIGTGVDTDGSFQQGSTAGRPTVILCFCFRAWSGQLRPQQ